MFLQMKNQDLNWEKTSMVFSHYTSFTNSRWQVLGKQLQSKNHIILQHLKKHGKVHMPKPFMPNFEAFGFGIGHFYYYTSFNLCQCWTFFRQSDVSMAGWYFNLKLEFIKFACLDSSQHNLPMPILTYKMAPFLHACGHKTMINSLANKKQILLQLQHIQDS